MREAVSIDTRPDCVTCPYRKLCGGGCPVGLVSVARNPLASEAVKRYSAQMTCATAKTAIEELLWLVAREGARENAGDGRASPTPT